MTVIARLHWWQLLHTTLRSLLVARQAVGIENFKIVSLTRIYPVDRSEESDTYFRFERQYYCIVFWFIRIRGRNSNMLSMQDNNIRILIFNLI